MNKHAHWLHEQLKSWEAEGLVSAPQAEQFRARYPEPQPGAPWGIIIFSGLGAVVGGLGVILLLAYNWQDIPKAVKLAVIFLSIGAAHFGGLKLFAANDWRKPTGEALTLLGSMLYGAGIWLVAQIYHIDEHFPNGFVLWAAGVLLLAWTMPSVAQGILACVLLVIWACTETWAFDQTLHFAPFLILLTVGGLSWRLRSRVLLAFALTGFTITLLSTAGALTGSLILTVWIHVAAAFVAAGKLCRRYDRFAESEPIWQFFGWLGFLFCVYLFTFAGLLKEILDWPKKLEDSLVPTYAWSALAVAMLAWVPLLVDLVRRRAKPVASEPSRGEDWLVPLTAVLVQLICVCDLYNLEWVIAGPFNLVFLALASAWMARGCRQAAFRPTLMGSLLFAALVAARYFDLFESLVARGIVFLVVGAIFFGEGILFFRNRRQSRPGGDAA